MADQVTRAQTLMWRPTHTGTALSLRTRMTVLTLVRRSHALETIFHTIQAAALGATKSNPSYGANGSFGTDIGIIFR